MAVRTEGLQIRRVVIEVIAVPVVHIQLYGVFRDEATALALLSDMNAVGATI